MNKFEILYHEIYHEFYNACNDKNILSKTPIPFIIDKNMKVSGKYDNGTLYFNDDPKSTINQKVSTIYHELTHYYDENKFKEYNYSEESIRILMLVYSEVHASYNAIFAFLGYKHLIVDSKLKLEKIVFNNYTLAQFISFSITQHIASMHNILGFKEAMYLLGEKRALLEIAKDFKAIYRAYDYKRLPDNIRQYIINIDNLINIKDYKHIDVKKIEENKLKAELALKEKSISDLLLEVPPGLDIKNLF